MSFTLIYEFDLDRVKMNQLAKYLGQSLFSWKFIVLTHRQRIAGRLHYPVHKVIGNKDFPHYAVYGIGRNRTETNRPNDPALICLTIVASRVNESIALSLGYDVAVNQRTASERRE